MAFLLASQSIKGPQSIEESNSTQVAQQRTLAGSVGRDYFGSNKRIWSLEYKNVNPTAFTTIQAIYNTYRTTGATQTWQVTETNYTVASTLVHVDVLVRQFNVRGSSYISDFTIILTEA